MRERGSTRSEVSAFADTLKPYVWTALGFTLILNLIALVAPIYMMQIYDRILTSGSYDTLILISVIALFLLGLFIAAEGGRRRVIQGAGRELGAGLNEATLKAGFASPEISQSDLTARVGDLSRVQQLLINGVISPILDAPFAPLFFMILFLIHPLLGTIGLLGGAGLIVIAILTERYSREKLEEASAGERLIQGELEHTIRQRGAISSMGMSQYAVRAWHVARMGSLAESLEPQAKVNFLVATSRSLRQMLQILILGIGAYLALTGSISAGAIIAASIIMGRALAPIDQSIGAWKHLIKGRAAWRDLKDFLQQNPEGFDEWRESTPLPRPKAHLELHDIAVGLPEAEQPLLQPASVQLPQGALAVLVGQSGAGKTTLLQTIAGAWPLKAGEIRLGGRDMSTWAEWDRGRYVGYLPQHVELLTGSVFNNIARFTEAETSEVFAAAQRAGVHDLILSLPMAYDTPVGYRGVHLSAGQRQAIGLARAFFRNPPLIILDEPTAHLDKQRSASLIALLKDFAAQPPESRTNTFVVATHDPSLLADADTVMTILNKRLVSMSGEDYQAKVRHLQQNPGRSETREIEGASK